MGVSGLVTQKEAAKQESAWMKDAYIEIKSRLTDPQFPCVFSLNAFRKSLVRFLFVENNTDDSIDYMAQGLQCYVDEARQWNGSLDTAYPLISVFNILDEGIRTARDFHMYGWSVLQAVHDRDETPWPSEITREPESTLWSMCFDGMPLFCNFSTPAHHLRKSRNLGKFFAIVINPRDRFDKFAGDTPSGRNTREKIRQRIYSYDGVTHASELGIFGSGVKEWKQYGLPEPDNEELQQCPFRYELETNLNSCGTTDDNREEACSV